MVATTPKTPIRLAAEAWFHANPYWLTHPFPKPNRNRGNIHPAYLEYCNHMLAVYQQEKPGQFSRRALAPYTRAVRGPYGIVESQEHNNKKRKIGDPGTVTYADVKANGYTPSFIVNRAATQKRYALTDHGRLVQLMSKEAFNDRQRELRQSICGSHNLQSFENDVTAKEVAQTVMHDPMEELGGLTLVEYATTKSGVYIWMTAQKVANGLKYESMRFITSGQKEKESQKHNAILMWNPQGVAVENNICPYSERFDYGFEDITYEECRLLGLDFIVLLDEIFVDRKDCCKIEQACQYEIDDLALGTQRLHRSPGAGMTHSVGGGGRMTVGATFLPPDFFQNHPDVVIVGSYNNRH
eukprot:CAMPEP_0198282176 /NCGR_PEP_ID=MMETSP1449-20131203/2022_1 /TAXON_ID=420275 /ORGANISM="Attheya septentrionalis, Strain CCMP2084" /LENGTH=354 /DNA_ID=CAMNT_0043978307 /DNA_START=326 /DNA_END=1390 /DNA_ORIENTATION=+